jgi:hypothetical protein
MSLTLTSTPDFLDEKGDTINIFPGFLPIEFSFKREDAQIASVGAGVDNKILITVAADLDTYLDAGDSIYLYAVGSTYTYDLSAEILTISYSFPNTSITIDAGYIEAATSGYVNYFKNWYVEMQLVDEVNTDIDLLGYNLKDDGTPSGFVTMDVSIINDKNDQIWPTASGVMEEGRTKFKVKYREVYDISSNSFTLIALEYIAIFATQEFTVDKILDPRVDPHIYYNYAFGGGVIHTDYNDPGKVIRVSFDELDVNGEYISTGNVIKSFPLGSYGFLFVNSDDYDNPLNDYTYYVDVDVDLVNISDYEPSEYDNTDYSV